jgi:hypothetical protein
MSREPALGQTQHVGRAQQKRGQDSTVELPHG